MSGWRERARSIGASLASTAVDVGLFTVLTLVLTGATALAGARWLCGAVGALVNFALNRWAFRAAEQSTARQGARFAIVAAAAVTLGAGVFWMLLRLTGLDPRLTQLLSLALVWVCFTFPLLRRWVFRPAPC